ncbi:hypothetical protein TNCV_3699981 [Trichonephila clavipes]|uniref:Uncharacterized protein n=1 Tax=Trichonephila clavipes TaxID=2585209 RepID=A0A8X6VL08_TRICX|nr:hypothetical protein TNCV_3699981 [Trichonephila clavipes]
MPPLKFAAPGRGPLCPALEPSLIGHLKNARAWLLDHLTLSTDWRCHLSRVFMESSALEQVVAIHSGMATEWAGVVVVGIPTGDVISRVFMESSALEQVVAIHSGMATEWAGLVSSQGMIWDRHCDSLSLNIPDLRELMEEVITKRNILAASHKVFDPLGITGPVLLLPKHWLQSLWKS